MIVCGQAVGRRGRGVEVPYGLDMLDTNTYTTMKFYT